MGRVWILVRGRVKQWLAGPEGKKGAGEVWNRRRAGVPKGIRRESAACKLPPGMAAEVLSSEHRRMPPRGERARGGDTQL